MKTAERERATRLRRDHGMSVREIAVAVSVSRSTASRWLREVPLTPEQDAALRARNPVFNAQMNGARANAERSRERRRGYQERGRRRVAAGAPAFIAACSLYWGEGGKGRDAVRFANSDPAMVHYFVHLMRTLFGVENEAIRIRLHLFADHEARIREIEGFWLRLLGLPRQCLNASAINRYSRASKRKRQGMLPLGTCHVAICRTAIVQELFGGIQELAGCDRSEWLG